MSAVIKNEGKEGGEFGHARMDPGVAKIMNVDLEKRDEKIKQLLKEQKVKERIRLSTSRGTHYASEDTIRLLEDIGADRILAMTATFYDMMFQDQWLDKFVRSHKDPHGDRLGLWIIEKMGGGAVWSSRRPRDARQLAHRDAWTSPKREPEKCGRRFKLDDARMWMRLMFLAARIEGLDAHRPFFNWYVDFISHFIAVYEFSAPPFAFESSQWSLDPNNIETYLNDGRLMKDVANQYY